MRTIEYNVKVQKDEHGNWGASCREAGLPPVYSSERRSVVWNVYKVIFEDLGKANNRDAFTDSLELLVNLIESE